MQNGQEKVSLSETREQSIYRLAGKKTDVRNCLPVMFKCYDTERKSVIWRASKLVIWRANFILNVWKKKQNRSSICVDIDVLFHFICLLLKYRRTCVFTLSWVLLLHVVEQEAFHISHIYFSRLFSDQSFLIIRSVDSLSNLNRRCTGRYCMYLSWFL